MKFKKSDEIFDYVMKNGGLKQQRSITNIKMICDQLEKDNVVITVISVSNRLIDAGIGPKNQTIRNNQNLIEYIKVRAKNQVIDYFINTDVENIRGDIKLKELILNLRIENQLLRKIISKYKIC